MEKDKSRSFDDSYNEQDDYERDGGDEKGRKFISGGHQRKKVCKFCTDNEFVLDYKNVRVIQSFLSEHGKIVPRRISGNCAFHQRQLTTEVKRARNLALVGYISIGTY